MGCSVVVGLCFAFLGCLCFKVTPRYLSHLFSHMGELSIETKRIDDRQSFKRVRHRQKKRAITSTYKSLLVVDTSNSAWTQVNSELPKDLRHK